jgi:DNA-binding PadR family transcriptional regulator
VSTSERNSSRTSPEYVLLGFLYQSPSHGYGLHQRLTAEFGDVWHASQSQTYNILKRLEAQGFITSTVIEQERLPARQELRLTTQGTQKFEAWLSQPTKASVHAIRVEFVTRLFFIRQYFPHKTRQMIAEQIYVVDDRIRKLKHSLATMAPELIINRLGLELRINLLSSVEGWLKDCLTLVDREGPEGEYDP